MLRKNYIICRLAGYAQAIMLVVAFVSCALTVNASTIDPTKPDSIQSKIVKAVAKKAEAEGSFQAKLNVYELAIEAHKLPKHYRIVCGLLFEAHEDARASNPRRQALEAYLKFTDSLDLSVFSKQEQTHVAYFLARYKIFDGYLNEGEAILIDILRKPDDEVSAYTRTSAHYMMAYCGYYTDNLERAAYHARKSAEGFAEMGDKRGALEGYDGASTTFLRLGIVDSALYYARRGLELANQVEPVYAENLFLNYAEALMHANEIDSAFVYVRRAEKTIKKSGRHAGLARSEYCVANLYSKAKDFRSALVHYKSAVDYFELSKEPYHIVDCLDSLANTYARLNQFEDAFLYGTKGFQLRDSLRNERVKQDADKLVMEYERDVLEKELKASQDERMLAQVVLSKRNYERVAGIGIVSTLLLLIGFIYYRATTRKRVTESLREEVNARTADLREHSRQLEIQAVRLKESNAELERFAYIASHDLKTPLRNVTSFLGLIKRRLPPEAMAQVAEYIEIAVSNAQQMHNLVTDVLEFSRLNSDKGNLTEEVTVQEVVNNVRRGMQAELEEANGSILCEGNATMVLPKGTLEQILGNLVGNGLKYNKSLAPLVKVVVADMGDQVRIAVNDNGIGIESQYHDRIFEVFRRLHTSDEYAGTGVGLAACRKVILRLGGEIRVDSAAGKGSTFTVDIPKKFTPVEVTNPYLESVSELV